MVDTFVPEDGSATYKGQIETIAKEGVTASDVRGAIMRYSTNYDTQSISDDTTTLCDFTGHYAEAYLDTDSAADLANSKIVVPTWANYAYVAGHIAWPNQTNGAGFCSLHLFRNGSSTGEDMFYHNRVYYPASLGSYVSHLATTGLWVPTNPDAAPPEEWTLHCRQNTGGAVSISRDQNLWLGVWFKA